MLSTSTNYVLSISLMSLSPRKPEKNKLEVIQTYSKDKKEHKLERIYLLALPLLIRKGHNNNMRLFYVIYLINLLLYKECINAMHLSGVGRFYVSPHTSRGFIRLITNKRWAWAISTCIDSLMGSNMEMGSKQSFTCAASTIRCWVVVVCGQVDQSVQTDNWAEDRTRE